MADRPLTEALAEYDEFGFVGVHQQDALAAAARKWAELEALVADGGRVVVETPPAATPCPHGQHTKHYPEAEVVWMGAGWGVDYGASCGSGGQRRIVLGEGAEPGGDQ